MFPLRTLTACYLIDPRKKTCRVSWNMRDVSVLFNADFISNMKTSFLLAAAPICLLIGCASNPFNQFYANYVNQMPPALQQRLLPPNPNPQIITVTAQDFHSTGHRLEQQGLVCIGFAGFSGGAPTQSQLVQQAKIVGADEVIFTSEYSHTQEGVRPIYSYQPGQTYSTHESGIVTGNSYGSGGSVYGSGTYYGQSTTTTPGTLHTDYIPYQQQIYNYGAAFWRRSKPGVIGARFAPIPDSLRSTLQRNTGAFVDLIVQDGAAFRANILEGDVIVQFADKPIATPQELLDLLPVYAGQKLSIKLIRGAQTMDAEVQLNNIK